MNEPVRLSVSGSERTKLLLRAGKDERPRAHAKAEAAAAAAAAVTLGHTGWSWSWTAKKTWLASILAGVVAAGGAVGLRSALEDRPALTEDEPWAPPARELAIRARSPDALEGDAPRDRATPAAVAPKPAAAGRAPVTWGGGAVVSVSELELVRRARLELRARRAREAIELLDWHAAVFPNGALEEEAAALRVEALALAGDGAAARAAAARFLARHPESAYAERVRSVSEATPR